MPTDPLSILVTAIGGGGHGEQILKALRMAQPGRYRIIGADVNPACPQFALVDEAVVIPRADAPNFMDAVLHVAKHFGARALFHGCEPELKIYAAQRVRIHDEGIFLPINPDSVIATCMDKVATGEFLTRHEFTPPRYRIIEKASDVDEVDWFPAIVKPYVGSGGSANCFIAQSQPALRKLAAYLEESGLLSGLMVQEYVGTPDQEYTVGVLLDMDGNLLNSIAVRRHLKSGLNTRISVPNRTERSDLGPSLVVSSGISHGDVGRFPEVTQACEKLAIALGAHGAINIQCRLTSDGVKVFEINPRFSGTTSIRAMMGYNEPDILLRRHIFGERIEKNFAYRSGTVLRNLTETIIGTREPSRWDQLS
jgi:carbamoyl-phosphate synthase large subunit